LDDATPFSMSDAQSLTNPRYRCDLCLTSKCRSQVQRITCSINLWTTDFHSLGIRRKQVGISCLTNINSANVDSRFTLVSHKKNEAYSLNNRPNDPYAGRRNVFRSLPRSRRAPKRPCFEPKPLRFSFKRPCFELKPRRFTFKRPCFGLKPRRFTFKRPCFGLKPRRFTFKPPCFELKPRCFAFKHLCLAG